MLDAKAFAGELASITKGMIAKAVEPLQLRIAELERQLAVIDATSGIAKRLDDMERRQTVVADDVTRLLDQ